MMTTQDKLNAAYRARLKCQQLTDVLVNMHMDITAASGSGHLIIEIETAVNKLQTEIHKNIDELEEELG